MRPADGAPWDAKLAVRELTSSGSLGSAGRDNRNRNRSFMTISSMRMAQRDSNEHSPSSDYCHDSGSLQRPAGRFIQHLCMGLGRGRHQLDLRQLSLTTWSFSWAGSDSVAPPVPVIVMSEAPLRLSMFPAPPAMHSSK